MTYHALLIGNSVFEADAGLNPLNAPTKDVARLHRALVDAKTGLFADENVRLVIERTSDELLDELDAFFAAAHRDDLLLLYYSGHGLLDERNHLFLCGRNTRSDRLLRTAVSNTRINEFIEQSVARATVIVLDCCSSGMFKGGDMGVPLAGPGRYVVSSTRGADLANDAATATGTSLFTEHLVVGLLGEAHDRDGDGYIDLREIYDYVRTKLAATSKQVPHSRFDGDAAVVLARREGAPQPSITAGPGPSARSGDPTFVLSENMITLPDVDPGETLAPEVVEIYRLGDAAVECTAESDASWLRTEVRGERVVIGLHPRAGHNRAKIMIRDRRSGTAQVLRVYVHVADRSQAAPATDDPPATHPPAATDARPAVDAPSATSGQGTAVAADRPATIRGVAVPGQPVRRTGEGSGAELPTVISTPVAVAPARHSANGHGRQRRRLAVTVGAVLSVVGAAGVLVAMNDTAGDADVLPAVAVPALLGLTQADAEVALLAKGLTPKAVPASPGSSCAPGQVIAQSPLAGRTAEKTTPVSFTVCGALSPAQPAAPDVRGKTGPDAAAAITAAQLKPQAGPSYPGGNCTRGRVAAQTPAAKSPLGRGATVTYALCPSPAATSARVRVPVLRGLTRDSAEAALRAVGLYPDFQRRDSTEPDGQVVESNPGGGSGVTAGATITVYLSRPAAQTVIVPALRGLSSSDARQALGRLGLAFRVLERSSDLPAGTVIDADPAEGQQVPADSTVTLVVAIAPDPSPPPD